jgi:hypothetical protein
MLGVEGIVVVGGGHARRKKGAHDAPELGARARQREVDGEAAGPQAGRSAASTGESKPPASSPSPPGRNIAATSAPPSRGGRAHGTARPAAA